MKQLLEIKNLHVSVEGKEIIKGINLKIKKNEVHALMGPNGSGKSSLANALMGNPFYKITRGSILFKGKNINKLKTDERARLGLFMSFQNPVEIPGLNFKSFLRTAFNSMHKNVSLKEFNELLSKTLSELKLSSEFLKRPLNYGFSGGEKKKAEILQLLLLKPDLMVIDEVDSGLDIDSLKTVCNAINNSKTRLTGLIVTHYKRILNYLKPDFVHVMFNGKIIESRTHEFAGLIEEKGYSWLMKK